MPKENTGNGLLLGTIVGGAIGVVATLLLAPKSGAKMRQDISDRIQAACQKTKEIAATIGDTTKEFVENVKEEATGLAEHAKESNENLKDTLIASKDEIKEKIGSSASTTNHL